MTHQVCAKARPLVLAACMLGAAVLAAPAFAQLGIGYQGLLLDAQGEWVAGPVDVSLQLWFSPDSTDAADQFYEEFHADVAVVDGVFAVPLGGGQVIGGDLGPLSEFFAPFAGVWLEIAVDGERLTPRQRIWSVPSALLAVTAADAEQLGGFDADELISRARSGLITTEQFSPHLIDFVLHDHAGVHANVSHLHPENAPATHAHDDRYPSEAELGSPGTINSPANPVHWTKLAGVPSGLADGADADTTYGAGTGLTLAGTTFRANDAILARKDAAAGAQSFDGGTLYLDYAGDRVGVNRTDPGEALDVIGNVEVSGDYRFGDPRTRYVTISGDAFVGRDYTSPAISSWTMQSGYAVVGTGSNATAEARAALHMPQGAALASFACSYRDASPDVDFSAFANLYQIEPATGARGFLAAASVGVEARNSPDNFTIDRASFAPTPIDNERFAYTIEIKLEHSPAQSDARIRFYGCRVGYTVEAVDF